MNTTKILAMIIVALVFICGLFFILTMSYYSSYGDKTTECNKLIARHSNDSTEIAKLNRSNEAKDNSIAQLQKYADSLFAQNEKSQKTISLLRGENRKRQEDNQRLSTEIERLQSDNKLLTTKNLETMDSLSELEQSWEKEKNILQLDYMKLSDAYEKAWTCIICVKKRGLWQHLWGTGKCPIPEKY